MLNLYPGSIVEAKSTGSTLNYLLNSSQGGSPEEPPRVMTLFEVIRTIKFIEADDRIVSLIFLSSFLLSLSFSRFLSLHLSLFLVLFRFTNFDFLFYSLAWNCS